MNSENMEIDVDSIAKKTEKEIKALFLNVPPFFKKYCYRKLQNKVAILDAEVKEMENLKDEIEEICKKQQHHKDREQFHKKEASLLDAHLKRIENEAAYKCGNPK